MGRDKIPLNPPFSKGETGEGIDPALRFFGRPSVLRQAQDERFREKDFLQNDRWSTG
jgi:hypothetical protein